MTINISEFKEIELIRSFAGTFPRHPNQLNGLLEADAEILKLPGSIEEYLVLKTDGISEEINEKLYEDPYLIGWISVTAPLSDIAAVGAEPTGILLSIVLPQQNAHDWIKRLQEGIHDACNAYGIYILGGDTNYADNFSISATAVAFVRNKKPLLRKGIQPGDILYSTASLGLGNAYAYSRFFDTSLNIQYKPEARLKESRIISEFAIACMDTSDGLFPALAFLSDLNSIGFSLDAPLQELLHPDALKVQQKAGLPSWMFMAGPHGEYELIFSIPAERNKDFESYCKKENWQPLCLGKIITDKQLRFTSDNLKINCTPAEIPNLFHKANGNIQSYFKLLTLQHENWSSVNLYA